MKKKLMYKNESLGIDFLVVMYIFIGFVFFFNNVLAEDKFDNKYLIGFAVFFTLAYLIGIVDTLIHRKKYNKIRTHGIRVEGNIVDFIFETKRRHDEREIIHKVEVEYVDPKTNEKVRVFSPKLNFSPQYNLGSKKCSVYILNNDIYISDFVPRQKEETNIWYGELGNQLEKKRNKDLTISIVIFVIIAVLMCYLSFKYGK